jgi:hypothetical protein
MDTILNGNDKLYVFCNPFLLQHVLQEFMKETIHTNEHNKYKSDVNNFFRDLDHDDQIRMENISITQSYPNTVEMTRISTKDTWY